MTVLYPNNLPYVSARWAFGMNRTDIQLLDITQRPEDWICTLMMLATVLLSQLFMCFRIISFAKHMSDWAGPRAKLKRWFATFALAVGWIACFAVSVTNCVIFTVSLGIACTSACGIEADAV